MAHLTGKPCHELETGRLRLRQWRQEDFEAYARFFADEKMARYVGGRKDRPELELGYWLKRDMQGKGYATEAALKSREYAYDALQAPPLVSYIHPDNEASKRVAERLGATLEKTIELLDHGPHCVYRHPKG